MNLIQLYETDKNGFHAGSKATSDVEAIAGKCNFTTIRIETRTYKLDLCSKIIRQIGWKKDWYNSLKHIGEGDILLIQSPFRCKVAGRENYIKRIKKKNVKIISVIHDVEELRGALYDKYYENEFRIILEYSDIFIVHNDVMKKFFIEKGISENRIVVLKVFDYLLKEEQVGNSEFDKSINIAGNLDINKSKYIYELNNIKGIKVRLFGPNYSDVMKDNADIEYLGAKKPEELPAELNRGFGLVWDGNSIDTCDGFTGNYLRYNNPHKMSLYLASNLPVIIWEEAAEAKFIAKNNLGICIETLNDLPYIMKQLTEEQYYTMCDNVKKMGMKLRKGYYMTAAINSAIEIIHN